MSEMFCPHCDEFICMVDYETEGNTECEHCDQTVHFIGNVFVDWSGEKANSNKEPNQ